MLARARHCRAGRKPEPRRACWRRRRARAAHAEYIDHGRRVRDRCHPDALLLPKPIAAGALVQLARQAREESKLIAQLSVKLRMCNQSRTRKDLGEAERERMPVGRPPWADAN
jgi:hypothetical protein